jgi:ABC-type nickel/cobalt efflux system permease component RcnA
LIQAGSQLEQYLARSSSDPVVLITALGVAFFLGAAHALTPGHGKTIVAAYLVGSRGRLIDAVYLGGVVTLTHTISVFALGLVTLYAARQTPLDRIYPWLSLASGFLVMAIGAWLVVDRASAHEHPEGGAYTHSHGLFGKPHTHGHSFFQKKEAEQGQRGGLLSLGISGGLVPCPEALVVLMLSISLRKIALGLGLLTSFSLGLATVLIAIGSAMVMAGPMVKRATGDSPWIKRLPVVSATVVTIVGIAMVVEAVRKL